MTHFAPGVELAARFILEAKIGAGTFATVWRAHDRVLKETVALKIFPSESLRAASAAQRAETEAVILHALDHPFIARSYAWIPRGDYTLLAMRYVPGSTLASELQRHASEGVGFSTLQVTTIVSKICDAVDYAHLRGIVHRDLKPKNLIVPSPEHPRSIAVLDFGVARVVHRDASEGTTIGRRLGTVLYMSPEQFRGEEVSPAADIFALATLTFEMLTLRYAWARDSSGQPLPVAERVLVDTNNNMETIMTRVSSGERPSVSKFRPDLPRGIDSVLARAWSPDPARRYRSTPEFAGAVTRKLGLSLRTARTKSITAVLLAGSACIIATAFYVNLAKGLAARRRPTPLPLQVGAVPGTIKPDSGVMATLPDAAAVIAAPPIEPTRPRARRALPDASVAAEAPAAVTIPEPAPRSRRAQLRATAAAIAAKFDAHRFDILIEDLRSEIPNLPESTRAKARRSLEAAWVRQDIGAVQEIIDQLP